jgi:ribose transport system permease protein
MMKKDLGLFVLILVVGTVVALRNERFLLPENISNTANQVGLFGIFSIGEAFVIVTGGIELSVGSIIALLGAVFIDLIVNHDVNWILAIAIIVVIGMTMGFVHGLLVTKANMQPFVVTLCGLLIYRGVARYYTKDATAGFGFGESFPTLEWLTAGRSQIFSPIARLFGFSSPTLAVPHSLIALVLVTFVAWVVLHRSVFGRYLYAIGKNEEAARYSGIRTNVVTLVAYVICCGLAAVSAIFWAMYTRSISPAVHGSFYELYAIAAAVLGGFSLRGGEGSIIGVVLGTILLQILQNLVNLLGIPSSLNFAVMGSVILIGVLADQQIASYREKNAGIRGQQAKTEGK